MADLVTTDPELTMLRNNKESGYNYRERRHDDWDENYTLYRDRVITNRLTQRQSVNIPLMKQTIRTLLKDVDDMPVLYFENIDNDRQAEVFKNEYWKYTSEEANNMSLNDIVDKKQVFHFGRSFDQWQIMNGQIKQTIQDPMDILVDRYTDPTDLHTSRFLIHTHIFMPLSRLKLNPMYDKTAIRRLEQWYSTKEGIIKAQGNAKLLADKNKKMQDMGLRDVDSPVLGETIVELTMHFVMRAGKGDNFEQIFMYVEAEDMAILMKAPLERVIGETRDNYFQTHYNYETWADDVERQDFWSDGIADIVRQPNKVLNAWFSQLVENRTLRNFGMHYYDATANEGEFSPGSFIPKAWGWYPIPGDPNKILKKVDIPDLSESLDEMQFLIGLMEKATGATATQQGADVGRQITLGEVKLALGEAKERIKGMSKFYTPAWKRRGRLYLKLLEAGAGELDAVKVYKKGKNTDNLYSREVKPNDWMTKSGYLCKVYSQEEKATQDTDTLQKINVAKSVMPNNRKLDEIYKRKLLEFADLTPDETNAIIEEEKEAVEQQPPLLGAGGEGDLGQGSSLPPASNGVTPNLIQPVQA